ncbi:hypothetical protein GCM10007874_45270 [Labrys miyagiensis]|uniref:SMC-Scp complex subunit ScpB n=1 Tax=Labrys miyagiensis TaxID=346912 RepID=A0ABQ6CNX2_9HYPH|nr:hypothetical protein GCM10007874_45270 [Labrys miyagiensis]
MYIRASELTEAPRPALTPLEATVLLAIGYFRPVTRGEPSKMFGREISRDLIADLRSDGFFWAGPRSPQPGAPYTYATTPGFREHFGFQTLRDLPDLERLEDAGLLSRARLLAEDLPTVPSEEEGRGRERGREMARMMLSKRWRATRYLAVPYPNEGSRSAVLPMVSKLGMSYMTVIPLT